MKYTHVLFDHDGVLVDTEHLYFRATSETLGSVGLDLDLRAYLKLQAVGGNAWQRMMTAGYDEVEVAHKRLERDQLYQHYIRTEKIDIDDVGIVLESLYTRFGLAIVTTAKQCDFDLIHKDRKIVQYMDLVLTNRDYMRSKPAPDPYLKALDHFGITPQQALVVEDSERGLKSAVAAGIDCAVVYHPFTAPQDFSQATYRIDKLSGLLDILNTEKH